MKSLLVPFTKSNPSSEKMAMSGWRSKNAVKKSSEARKILKKPELRVLERIK